MIFSKLGRSFSRSARSRFPNGALLVGYDVRSSDVIGHLPRFGGGSGELGLLKGYLTSIGASKGAGERSPLENWRLLLGFRRFFSSDSSNGRNYENYYPKNKREIPKGGENQKSESREDSSTDEQENFMKQLYNYIAPLLFIGLLFSSIFSGSDKREISFQEFKNKLLEPGLVDRIVVSNKSVAKVYVRSSPKNSNQTQDNDINRTTANAPSGKTTSQYMYYFNIGSVESFEEKLEEAQEALGVDPHNFVPVIYLNEIIWYQELIKYAPTMLLVGLIYFFGKRMQGGFNIGGGPGGGNRGIFNIGKAHVTKLDKNYKNKENTQNYPFSSPLAVGQNPTHQSTKSRPVGCKDGQLAAQSGIQGPCQVPASSSFSVDLICSNSSHRGSKWTATQPPS